jgi:hypothetical protein
MSSDDRRSVDAAFAAHKREQAQRALSMTPAERLRWLESTVRELGKLRGLARPVTKAAART